jgi:hypothetical protein
VSIDPSTDAAALIPVPTFLFQGSILLGSICESLLGPAAGGRQLVHPLLIAGWCGLLTQVRAQFLACFCINMAEIKRCGLLFGLAAGDR